jgi:hypothetical protein
MFSDNQTGRNLTTSTLSPLQEELLIEYELDTATLSAWSNFFLFVLALVFVFSILLNTLSILSIINMRKFTPINMLIMNLAVADLIYTSGIPMFSFHFLSKSWVFGVAGCRFFMFTEFSGVICSVLTVTVLSVERFFDVTEFYKQRRCQFFTKFKVTFNRLLV